MVAISDVVSNTDVLVRDTDASVEEELERFEHEMKRQKRKIERGRKIVEARGRIMVMLIGLARYEPHYECVRAFIEDEWKSIQ